MRKLSLLICVLVILVAGSAKAVTIFETFDSDPTAGSWTSNTGTDGSSYTYQATSYVAGSSSGYLDANVDAKSFTRYGTDISSEGLTMDDEWWMSFDVHCNEDYYSSRAIFGLMELATTNAAEVGAKLHYSRNTTWDRLSMYLNHADGAGWTNQKSIDAEDPAGNYDLPIQGYSYTHLDELFMRVKFYSDGDVDSDGFAEVKMEIYDLRGDPDTDLMMSSAWNNDDSPPLLVASTFALNYFGFGNYDGKSTADYTQLFNLDNFYFSTDAAMAVNPTADFVPEPATLCLLGLGGLIIRRKRA